MILKIYGSAKVYETHRAVWNFLKYLESKYTFKLKNLEKSKYENTLLSFEVETQNNKMEELIGTHLWINTSPFRKNIQRKNWYFKVKKEEKIKDYNFYKKDIIIKTMRSPKKGGQNVNKRDSGVKVYYKNIEAICFDYRTQNKNKQVAIQRLHEKYKQSLLSKKQSIDKYNWIESKEIKASPIKIFKGDKFKELFNENIIEI